MTNCKKKEHVIIFKQYYSGELGRICLPLQFKIISFIILRVSFGNPLTPAHNNCLLCSMTNFTNCHVKHICVTYRPSNKINNLDHTEVENKPMSLQTFKYFLVSFRVTTKIYQIMYLLHAKLFLLHFRL